MLYLIPIWFLNALSLLQSWKGIIRPNHDIIILFFILLFFLLQGIIKITELFQHSPQSFIFFSRSYLPYQKFWLHFRLRCINCGGLSAFFDLICSLYFIYDLNGQIHNWWHELLKSISESSKTLSNSPVHNTDVYRVVHQWWRNQKPAGNMMKVRFLKVSGRFLKVS